MPRKADGKGKVRADLEAALGALAAHNECASLVDERIHQAIRRSGLNALLDPALSDLKRMCADVADARSQVCAAINKLME